MATILCVTDGRPGMLYSCVELARRLDAAGHRLTFASQPHRRELIERHSLEFLPLDPSYYDEFLAADARTGTLNRLLNLRRRREQAKDSLTVGNFARVVSDLQPDLVLIDGEMHEHIIALAGTDVPLTLLNTFVSIWRRPGLPPPHHLVRPGIGWQGSRAGMSLLWLALRMRKWLRSGLQRTRRVGCDRLSVLRHLADETGFDLRREIDTGQWLIPFTYRSFPVLSLHAFEFEFPHRPPERAHYVGPMVLRSRLDRALAADDRARLEQILARRRQAGGKRKLVYAGFGSSLSTDLAFLRRLVRVCELRPEWDLVISLSERISAADLGPLPQGVQAFSWVPQIDILSHTDVMVTHGGINTIDECVLSGVPMLVYCGFETDMAGNTARVLHHGIGIAGDRRRESTPAICAHIDRLLHESEYRRNVNRLRQQYRTYATDRVAEGVIDSLLAAGIKIGNSASSDLTGGGR